MPQESLRFGSGDRQVAELLSGQESQDFVAAGLRADEVRMLLDVFDQAFLILPHLEEIVVLAELFDWTFAVGTEAVLDIFFGPEPFIKCAVPSSVISLINQLFIVELLKISLNDCLCAVRRSF